MPELAEVEWYRKQWDVGLNQKVIEVHLHLQKRVFRDTDGLALQTVLTGAKFLGSEARGKQMMFRFTRGAWLGVHLGMSGRLQVHGRDHPAGKHDHLVLVQRRQALVYSDARMFGRVRFHRGPEEPAWWSAHPPSLASAAFTTPVLGTALERHPRAPIKTVLLAQSIFPGVGNWMADEILWQSGIHPQTLAAELTAEQLRTLWKKTRSVCRTALRTIGADWSDPPKTWLIHTRRTRTGRCPRHQLPLERTSIGGRTTAWCAACQPARPGSPR